METTDLTRSVTAEEYAELVENRGETALVCFLSDWSAPCRELLPQLKLLAQSCFGRVQVLLLDPDEAPLVALKWEVNSIPSVLLIRDGELLDRQVGIRTAEELSEILDRKLKN